MALRLVLGNKNYSSWSFRPWLALKVAGIPFEETVVPIYIPGAREKILEFSPSGKVPVLIDGAVHVWESLAIIEYAAEKFPAAGLWPQSTESRAHARAVANEMHGGFLPLRRACPMNMRRRPGAIALSADVLADVARIEEIWTDCQARYGGPFLLGAFCAADAMFAPVVSRFHTYAVAVGPVTRAYMDAIMALPAWGEWQAAAAQEKWVLPQYEMG
ncbi:MAG: glutathione S-transferase family protein [Xanthobacteraceae bacterium]|nr:glutathione S-transferase family protein [Xanthobacteraceae bacterium]